MKYAFVILLCLIPATASAQESKATIYIYKGWHVATMWRAAFSVFCDEKEIARLDRGIYLVATLPPGKHDFRSKNKKAGGITLDVKTGGVYYLRLDTESGVQVTNARLTIATAEQAEYDLKQMKPIDEDDIKDRSIVSSGPLPKAFTRDVETKPALETKPTQETKPASEPKKCYEGGRKVPCPKD